MTQNGHRFFSAGRHRSGSGSDVRCIAFTHYHTIVSPVSSFRVSIQLLREIELDVLAGLDRNSLETYQMVSKQKREFVHRHRQLFAATGNTFSAGGESEGCTRSCLSLESNLLIQVKIMVVLNLNF